MEIRYHRFNGITAIATKLIVVLFFLSIFLGMNFCFAANPPNPGDPDFIGPVAPNGLNNAFKTDAGSPLNSAAVQGGGFDTSVTLETIVSAVITMVLRLMGVIFLVLAIYGGYTWMMAGGNDEAVAKAKKTITNAIIGIIIVLSAYALVRIIVSVVGSKVFK